MPLDTDKIIHACEKLYTQTKRLTYTDDRDGCREQIVDTFKAMATDLGKLAVPDLLQDWSRVHLASMDLHSAAIQAEAARAGTFKHVGCEAALLQSLIAFAAVLGFILEDAATARIDTTPEDEIARRYAEGHMQEAAE